ncbi:hypothetical protein, partial [uncultured Corynebacterium sp.]|uniref:hypothetical protein n=1 Tax=uncultured Corynebacterium sp. TaxID=159447 RepID=UPI0025D8F523
MASLTAIALAATGIPVAQSQETPPVTGKVFLDYGGDGEFTVGTDSPLGGITVTAYDESGDSVGSTTTSVNDQGEGNYTLNTSVAEDAPLRIEFTDLPQGMNDSFNAGQSSVQFALAGASGIDFGVLDVNQYNPIAAGAAGSDPTVGTAILAAGRHDHVAAADTEVLVATKWNVGQNVSGGNADFAARTTWATYGEVGSIFSVAADTVSNRVFAGAAYKRISDLGPEGLGGIYYVSNALDAAGTPQEGDTPRGFDVVADLGINVGQDLIASRPALGEPNLLIPDVNAFENAMKVGIGGMAIDSQAQILYFVNLFDKRVYAIDISTVEEPRLIASIAAPTNAGQRAFALTLNQGQLYVGYNDTGESEAWRSAEDAEMKYYVDRIDVLDRDASSFTGSWSNVLNDGDLSYEKGSVTNNWGGSGNLPEFTEAYPQVSQWNSWTDTWIEQPDPPVADWDAYVKEQSRMGRTVGIFDDSRSWGHKTHVYPQPMLSGLAFDQEGYLTLAFADRTGFQGGNRNWAAYEQPAQQHSVADLWESLSSGDLLIAAPESEGGFQITQWTPESNGSAGDRTGTGQDNQGPG